MVTRWERPVADPVVVVGPAVLVELVAAVVLAPRGEVARSLDQGNSQPVTPLCQGLLRVPADWHHQVV